MSVHKITAIHEFGNYLAENKLVFVKWGASFCQTCKNIQPIYEQLAEVNKDNAVFLSVEIDGQYNENQEGMDHLIKDLYEVSLIPLFQVFKNGFLDDKFFGSGGDDDVDILKTFINKNIIK